jgi:hypothetical protein
LASPRPADGKSAGIVATLAAGTAVVAYHLSRRQPITSLDVVTLAFGACNAVLYFGFSVTVLMRHIDAAGRPLHQTPRARRFAARPSGD